MLDFLEFQISGFPDKWLGGNKERDGGQSGGQTDAHFRALFVAIFQAARLPVTMHCIAVCRGGVNSNEVKGLFQSSRVGGTYRNLG